MIPYNKYETKEFAPVASKLRERPTSRLRKPRTTRTVDVKVNSGDLDYLSDFLKVTAFYIEDLEDIVGEEMMDFWQARENAMRIVTEAMVQRVEA